MCKKKGTIGHRNLLFGWWAATVLCCAGAVIICTLAAFPSVLVGMQLVELGGLYAGSPGRGLGLALGLSGGYLLFGCILLFLLCCVARLVPGAGWEGERDIGDPGNLGFFVVSAIRIVAQHGFLPFITGTPLIVAFYRGMGAKIGKRTMVFTTKISDHSLVDVGRDCTLGVDCTIICHSGRGGKWMRRRVVIGDRVTIGRGATVMPGVCIQDDVTVGAHSFVPKGRVLESGKTYAGVPVQELADDGQTSRER